MKYTFKQEDKDGGHVTVSFEADTLDRILEHFEDFLKGCGYHEKNIDDMMNRDL